MQSPILLRSYKKPLLTFLTSLSIDKMSVMLFSRSLVISVTGWRVLCSLSSWALRCWKKKKDKTVCHQKCMTWPMRALFPITCRCCRAVWLLRLRPLALSTLSSASNSSSPNSLIAESEAMRESPLWIRMSCFISAAAFMSLLMSSNTAKFRYQSYLILATECLLTLISTIIFSLIMKLLICSCVSEMVWLIVLVLCSV